MRQNKDFIRMLIVVRALFVFCVGCLLFLHLGILDGLIGKKDVRVEAQTETTGRRSGEGNRQSVKVTNNVGSSNAPVSIMPMDQIRAIDETLPELNFSGLRYLIGGALEDDEAECVSQTIASFYQALSDKDESTMLTLISSKMTFLGKKDATKVDVLQFMKKIYAVDVLEIQFYLDEFNIKRGKSDDGENLYEAELNVDAKFSREDLSKETYANYACKMVLKSNYKVVSFDLKKISSY